MKEEEKENENEKQESENDKRIKKKREVYKKIKEDTEKAYKEGGFGTDKAQAIESYNTALIL